MKKRVLALIVVAVLMLQTTIVYGKTDGEKLKDLDLIAGNSAGELMEDKALTRAELAVLLSQLTKTADEAKVYSEDMGYSDVDMTSWYSGYVNFAISKGWLKGTGNKQFDPLGTVTEEMVTTVFLRVLGYQPSWGQATLKMIGLGGYVAVDNSDAIRRGEVFEYMYRVLMMETVDESLMLAQVIDLDLAELNLDNYYATMNDDTYLNLDGTVADYRADKLLATGSGYMANINNENYYILADGTVKNEEAYDFQYASYFTLNGSYERYNVYRQVDKMTYLVLNEAQEIVAEGTYVDMGDYQLNGLSDDYIIYGLTGKLLDEYGEYLTDLEGNVLLGNNEEENHFYEIASKQYVIDYYRVDKTSMPNMRIYDMDKQAYVIDTVEATKAAHLYGDTFVFYSDEKVFRKLDVVTGESKTFAIEEGAQVVDFSYVKDLEAIILRYLLDSTIYSVVLDTDLNPLSVVNRNVLKIEHIQQSPYRLVTLEKKWEQDFWVVNSQFEQLIDFGTVAPFVVTFDDVSYLCSAIDSVSTYYDLVTMEVVEFPKVETPAVEQAAILANDAVLNYHHEIGRFTIVSSTGEIIFDQLKNNELFLNLGLIAKKDSDGFVSIYDYSGKIVEGFATNYLMVYPVNSQFLLAYDGDNTYVLDNQGKVLAGPFEGFYKLNLKYQD